LAHDLGTTGDKVTLFDAATGRPVATSIEEYPTAYEAPGWAEQDPGDWRRAVLRGTAGVLGQAGADPSDVAAVGFSGMMNGALLLDAAGSPLRSAIIWADQRATTEAEEIRARFGLEAFYSRTGNRPGAGYTAAKLLWVKKHQPEIHMRARWVVQAKDFAAFVLTGNIATDHSDASNTNLYDIRTRAWAGDLVEALGLDPAKLPPIVPSTSLIGEVTSDAARATGLRAGTPVILGGGDGACATVGAGSVSPGQAYLYIGSSSWLAYTAEQPLFDPEFRTFNLAHLDPRLVFPLGTMQSAGAALDWLERLFRGDGVTPLHGALDDAAAELPPGAGGLLFLPHLIGERSPYWNPLARGAFVGLTLAHGRAHLARAVLEGVAFNLRSILAALSTQQGETETSLPFASLPVLGGGARSVVWRRILADVLGVPLRSAELPAAATSLGAAVAAGVGVGLYPGLGVARDLVRLAAAEAPDPGRVRAYDSIYRLWLEAYRASEPFFTPLGRLPSG
jgi:xylulokinase